MHEHSYDPALKPVLKALAADLYQALGPDLVGLYLYGSAVSGGFDPGVSDLDLLAITRRSVETLDLPILDGVHNRVIERDASWRDRLEVAYVAEATVAGTTGRDPVAVISPGEPFHITRPASDWLQNWYLVRETGIALIGPPAKVIIRPISKEEFLAALRAYLRYVRGVDDLAYAVLTACRAVCTLNTGQPCSKQEGAAWARQRKPEWAWLIDAAVAARQSRGSESFQDGETRAAAKRFLDLLSV